MSYGVDYIDYVKDEDLMFIYNGNNMKMGYVINAKFRMKLLLEVPAEVTCDINIDNDYDRSNGKINDSSVLMYLQWFVSYCSLTNDNSNITIITISNERNSK